MEFRLNKIDPEVRQRVKETTSAGKVHTKTGITISKDEKDRENKKERNFDSELKKYKDKKGKKLFLVEASKVEEVKIDAYKEESGAPSKDEAKGSILDVRK